jgi:putative glutamine amidotransferase
LSNPEILVVAPSGLREKYGPYLQAIVRAGGEPVLDLPGEHLFGEPAALLAFVRGFAGILLPGGADIDPKHYREPEHRTIVKPKEDEAGLDDSQLAVGRLVLAEDIPTLAICRGMQILSVAAGSPLIQDLPSQRPSQIAHQLKRPRDYPAHAVDIAPGSRLAKASGADRFEVNSRHHQAVPDYPGRTVVGPLSIVAHAPDGVIEGLEIPGRRFLVAVQWHPENLVEFHRPSANLFADFLAACL